VEERRHYLRIGRWAAISYTTRSAQFKSGSRASNISEGGICFPTVGRFDPGTVLDMEIRLEETQAPIRAMAEVIWSKAREDSRYPFEAGLRFVDIDAGLQDKIRKLVEEILKNR